MKIFLSVRIFLIYLQVICGWTVDEDYGLRVMAMGILQLYRGNTAGLRCMESNGEQHWAVLTPTDGWTWVLVRTGTVPNSIRTSRISVGLGFGWWGQRQTALALGPVSGWCMKTVKRGRCGQFRRGRAISHRTVQCK